MAPKRRHGLGGRGKNKKRKLNLMTIRQKQDYREFGESHPLESRDRVRSYTKVEDSKTEDVNKSDPETSSDESEEETSVMKQLMTEIGAKEEEPESEKEEDVDDDDDDDDDKEGDDSIMEEQDLSHSESDEDEVATDNEADDQEEESETDEANDDTVLKPKTESADNHSDGVDDKDDSEEEESDDEEDELILKESDPFSIHFEAIDISSVAENKDLKWQKNKVKIPNLGDCLLFYKDSEYLPEPGMDKNLKKLHVKNKLCSQLRHTNTQIANIQLKSKENLTQLQHRLFCVINSYQDLLYPKQTHHNTEEIRLVYCLHALNHVLKTRSRIIAHNAKLKNRKEESVDDDDIEYRDQGLTRPKVLILLPYRDRALKVANMIISLLSDSQQANVSNRKRFESEYSELEKSDLAEKGYKPEDFRKTFEGNTDDNFRVGISVSKKSLRLYSPFYESDIILASPLGLRMIIGLEGDRERDFDFLSSIEVLIADQTDVFLMQNWDHIQHVFKHLHLQPKQSHGVDFSRVRMWSINGWSKHYRQTVIFSSVLLPEILTIFNKHCHNYTGKVLVHRDAKDGTIKSSVSDAPQIFHRVICDSPDGLSQRKAKFEYFKKKIIPYHTSAGMKQTLIYCSYYSFVQLRNYFRETEVDFLFMNEYDTEKHMRNARIHFRKRHPHFMLYTERLHFHYRFKLRGIHHIVWFDLPQYPHFYPELVNLMETSHQACTTTVLFTKFDAQKLIEIVGNKQATHMLAAEKSVNMITVS